NVLFGIVRTSSLMAAMIRLLSESKRVERAARGVVGLFEDMVLDQPVDHGVQVTRLHPLGLVKPGADVGAARPIRRDMSLFVLVGALGNGGENEPFGRIELMNELSQLRESIDRLIRGNRPSDA